MESKLDALDWQILDCLQKDARASYVEIGDHVGLTASAVVKRVRRLEDDRVITGYHAHVDLTRIGRPITATVHINIQGDTKPMNELVRITPEILECHSITGPDCYMMKIAVGSMQSLQSLLEKLSQYGMTKTSIILSSPIDWKAVESTE
jgi:Lrp/AsnC family leucine-responsive transcriptional regulator